MVKKLLETADYNGLCSDSDTYYIWWEKGEAVSINGFIETECPTIKRRYKLFITKDYRLIVVNTDKNWKDHGKPYVIFSAFSRWINDAILLDQVTFHDLNFDISKICNIWSSDESILHV